MSTEYLGKLASQQPLDHARLALHIEANSRHSLRSEPRYWPAVVMALALCAGAAAAMIW